MESSDYLYLKKHYGEKFARLCRDKFPLIMSVEGMMTDIISNTFAPSKNLYADIIENFKDFKKYILGAYSLKESRPLLFSEKEKTTQSPYEIFAKAGYKLYPECKSYDDLEQFKKYYSIDELPCSFSKTVDTFSNYRIWFAVKNNALNIKRSKIPSREDQYSLSVLIIKWTIGENSTIELVSRYNHGVTNPNATLNNDLDKISNGLAYSFIKHFNIDISPNYMFNLSMPGYITDSSGKLHKISCNDDSAKFCENNTVIWYGMPYYYDPDYYLIADSVIFDLKKKRCEFFSNEFNQSFANAIGKILDLKVKKNSDNTKLLTIIPKTGKNIEILIDDRNRIVSYKNENVKVIGDNFMLHNTECKDIFLPNVKSIGDRFLLNNNSLRKIDLQKIESIGKNFAYSNNCCEYVNLPNLKKINYGFMPFNSSLKIFNVPKLNSNSYYNLSSQFQLLLNNDRTMFKI